MRTVFNPTFILALMLPFISFSQNDLRLLNGKTVPYFKYSVDYDAEMFYYQTEKSNGKRVTRSVLLEDVYAFTDSLQCEVILYKPVSPDQMSVVQMGNYVTGASLARADYNPYWLMAGGFVLSGAGMYVFDNPMIGLVVPIVYSTSVSFIKPSRDQFILAHPEYADDEDVLYGYRQMGKNKSMKYGIIGSAGGVITGFIISSFLSSGN